VEATQVVELVESLLSSARVKVSTRDIGVVCGFRAQVLKLRKLLRARGLGAVNVGQVEDFQGREEKVIIISTVVARRDRVEHALRFMEDSQALEASGASGSISSGGGGGGGGCESDEAAGGENEAGGGSPGEWGQLGLLLSPKRFNVAMTRAQALCVVVGAPAPLCRDPCWRRLLEHVVSRGGWFGAGCAELGVGLNGTDPSAGTDGAALLDHIAGLGSADLLGGGDVGTVYPSGVSYGGESEWRVML